MSNVSVEIKPNGLNQRNLVDLLYAVIYSIKGICAKLDDDDTTDDTYEDDVYTAIFNGNIENSLGGQLINEPLTTGVLTKNDRFFVMTPTGMSEGALLECLYQIFDMFETLTEQLDADDATTSNYEALIYTAIFLWKVENCKGDALGNGTTYYFRPGGSYGPELVDLLYAIVDALETLTEKLDTDAAPAGSDYEALWYTATILGRIENSKGSVVGNDPTWSP